MQRSRLITDFAEEARFLQEVERRRRNCVFPPPPAVDKEALFKEASKILENNKSMAAVTAAEHFIVLTDDITKEPTRSLAIQLKNIYTAYSVLYMHAPHRDHAIKKLQASQLMTAEEHAGIQLDYSHMLCMAPERDPDCLGEAHPTSESPRRTA